MTAPTTSLDPELDSGTEAVGTAEADPEEKQAAVTPESPEPESEAQPARPRQSAAAVRAALRAGRGRRIVRTVATAASLLSVLILGFAGYAYGLSRLQEQHSQANLYRVLAAELAQATAPVSPSPDGVPLAIMDIPAIGVHQAVIVEGTTGADLAKGPGHRRDTVLPGQPGVSVVMGRSGTFGAPFAALTGLQVGDKIDFTTGEGTFTYTVNAFGQGSKPIVDPFKNRLVLATGDSTWIPTHAVYVGAHLDGEPAGGSGQRGTQSDLDKPLASDTDAWPTLQLWALALALAVAATVGLSAVWNRRAVYLSMAPVLAALLWCVYENAAILLPNLN
ncbi:sortase [Catenulispora pinistramenti]|uniref:sortase n=1 Tax=Catenulispora pinistramenti TaxID=2705254 RepID=UPI002E764C40|nr:sortase [Catenulispora pinistramenti]